MQTPHLEEQPKYDWLFETTEGDLLANSLLRNFKCDSIKWIGWDYIQSTDDHPIYCVCMQYGDDRIRTETMSGEMLLNYYKEEVVRERYRES